FSADSTGQFSPLGRLHAASSSHLPVWTNTISASSTPALLQELEEQVSGTGTKQEKPKWAFFRSHFRNKSSSTPSSTRSSSPSTQSLSRSETQLPEEDTTMEVLACPAIPLPPKAMMREREGIQHHFSKQPPERRRTVSTSTLDSAASEEKKMRRTVVLLAGQLRTSQKEVPTSESEVVDDQTDSSPTSDP
ncbi:hypothetical protein BT69DRAFT_1285261, partial [Atractiella rhizophila]